MCSSDDVRSTFLRPIMPHLRQNALDSPAEHNQVKASILITGTPIEIQTCNGRPHPPNNVTLSAQETATKNNQTKRAKCAA